MSIATVETTTVVQARTRRGVPAARPRRKTRATVLWVCAMLLTAEGAVRLRAWYRHGTAGPVADIYETDDLLGRRLRSGARLYGRDRSLSINRWGFRGVDIPKEKPPNTLRIAALGGSTTFGLEAGRDEAVWVARLAGLLGQRAGAGHYDTINAGVPGYTLDACTRQLTRRVLPLNPDVVIVYSLAVDLAAHARRQFGHTAAGLSRESSLAAFAYEHSLLLNLIRVNTTAFRSKQLCVPHRKRLDERGIVEYVARLERLITICRQHDLELILCTCPRAFGDESAPTDQYMLAQSALAHNPSLSLRGINDGYTRYNEAVRRTALKHDIPLADLDALVPKRRRYFADAVHLNDAGHELVAEVIAQTMTGVNRRATLAREGS